MNPAQLVTILQRGTTPARREEAARSLAGIDGKRHPEVVTALLTAARQDEAPEVRLACVRNLARLDLDTPSVLEVFRALESDPDLAVRKEATLAAVSLLTRHGRPTPPAPPGAHLLSGN
jgi:HEAT repeat protein